MGLLISQQHLVLLHRVHICIQWQDLAAQKMEDKNYKDLVRRLERNLLVLLCRKDSRCGSSRLCEKSPLVKEGLGMLFSFATTLLPVKSAGRDHCIPTQVGFCPGSSVPKLRSHV
jgi:hypothetical protein